MKALFGIRGRRISSLQVGWSCEADGSAVRVKVIRIKTSK